MKQKRESKPTPISPRQLIERSVMPRLTLYAWLLVTGFVGTAAVGAEGVNPSPVFVADAGQTAPASSKDEFYRRAREEMEPAERIGALLREKKFQEAKAAIENTPGAEIWGGAVLLRNLNRIPLYATDNKCKTGEVKYEGKEVEELLVALMKRYDVNDTFHGRFVNNSSTASFLDGLYGFSYNTPSCFDKSRIVGLINLMLENGFKTDFFGEENMGSYESKFSSIMSLGNLALAGRILKGGIRVNQENRIYLFARAERMDMVKLLESHGYKLTKAEYKKLFDLQKQAPDRFLTTKTEPEVIAYYKSKLN